MFFVLGIFCAVCTGFAQDAARQFLADLPAPAADASEALHRCPDTNDTLLTRFIDDLTTLTREDTANGKDLLRLHHAIFVKLFGTLQRKLEEDILAAGEQIDREIRNCPKTRNGNEMEVYQAACVEEAERRGRLRRVAAVDDYLSYVKEAWPGYLHEINAMLAASKQAAWLLVLQVARNAATITETAAQFAK